LFIYKFTARRR